MIKLIVCDVDGTIMDKANSTDQGDLEKIHEIQNKGVRFMFATGRDMNMMLHVIERCQVYDDLIINNGTQYRNYEGTVNITKPMKEQSFRQVIDILEKNNYHISIHTTKGKYILTDFDHYWDWHVELLKMDHKFEDVSELPEATFFRREGFLRDCTSVKNIDEMYAQGAQPLKIDARHLDEEEVKGVYDRLNVIPHLNISSSYGSNVEITCDDYDKGIMLKEVLKMLGLSIEEVATFGDGLNDVCMLEGFPYSFAPDNACDTAKEKATFVLKNKGGYGAVKEGIEKLEELKLI